MSGRQEVDITVIGAGVVGLSVASQVARKDRNVIVVEKHEQFGQETSSRNSEVIHAGVYYPEGSLKAKLCVEGNTMMYQICKENSIPHNPIEKLIVATDEGEEKILGDLEKGKGKLMKKFEKLTPELLAEELDWFYGKQPKQNYLMLAISEILHHEGQISAILGVEKRMQGT